MGGERDAPYEPFCGILLTDTFALHEHRDMLDDLLPDNAERRTRQRDLDIRVIVGNPPYVVGEEDGNSEDARVEYPMLDERIRDTYAARTKAQNKNGLYNAYIRAIRWASDRLGEDGGVLAFVTNGGFLDGNASAGVRRCLVEEFSDLRIFDLRGNQRTSGERSRQEGGKIFDAGSRAPDRRVGVDEATGSKERGRDPLPRYRRLSEPRRQAADRARVRQRGWRGGGRRMETGRSG